MGGASGHAVDSLDRRVVLAGWLCFSFSDAACSLSARRDVEDLRRGSESPPNTIKQKQKKGAALAAQAPCWIAASESRVGVEGKGRGGFEAWA